MCTQNIPAFVDSPLVSTYTLFLNSRGRVLFDTFLTKIPYFEQQEPAFYIDIHKTQANDFAQHVEKYRLKKEVALHDMTEILEVYATFSEGTCPDGEEGSPQKLEELDVPQVEDQPKGIGYTSFIDPRTRFMGTRTISVGDALEVEGDSEVVAGSQDHYEVFRMMQGLVEGSAAAGHIPHFLNYQFQGAIAPAKGCYIGQELVARASAQGETRRVLLPCCFIQPNYLDSNGRLKALRIDTFVQSPEASLTGQRVFDASGKEVGKVINSFKSVGLVAISNEDISGQQYKLESGGELAFWKPVWLDRILGKDAKS